MVSLPEAAELLAAEVLSAVPMDEREADALDEPRRQPADALPSAAHSGPNSVVASAGPPGEGATATNVVPFPHTPPSPQTSSMSRTKRNEPAPDLGAELQSLLTGLRGADAFDLDDRLARVVCIEARLDARIGPLLALIWKRMRGTGWVWILRGPGRWCASSARQS
jgi:hypothetical protein